MSTLLDDVRYAWRMLLKTRGASFAALVAFAVGLGANMATYSIADAILFRPLLLPDLDRLVQVSTLHPGSPFPNNLTPADFREIQRDTRTIEGLAATEWTTRNLTGVGTPEQVRAFRVTANFFTIIGAQPMLGRTFAPDEDTPGRDDRLVLAHGLWTRLGADASIVGKTVRLNDRPYQVIGVMPAETRYPAPAEMWIPLALSSEGWLDRDSSYLDGVARLAPGVSVAEADAEMKGLMARIVAEHPQTHRGRTAHAAPLRDAASGNLTRDFTLLLLGAVAFVLVIACANVATLQFARVAARSREFAIRSALGGQRWRVVRQLIVEGLLLAFAGGAVSILFAVWSVDFMRGAMPAEVKIHIPGWDRMSVNSHALAYSLALGTLSGIVAGLAAVFLAVRSDVSSALKEGGRGSAGSRGRHRVKSALVLCQVGLSLVLLIGGGLTLKGVRTLANPLPNAAPEEILTARIALPDSKYNTQEARRTFAARALDALNAIPGATAVSTISELPYSGEGRSASFRIEGEPIVPGERPRAHARSVSDNYFTTMRIPVHAGRAFAIADDANAPDVAVVSEAFVRRFFPKGDAIGRRITVSADNAPTPRWSTIVGVVGDVLHDWTDRSPRPTLYRPNAQAPRASLVLAIRAKSDPLSLTSSVRAAIASVDPDQPLSTPLTLRDVIDHYIIGLMYVAGMMSAFGLGALALAIIGLYGLLAYDVQERTREIGVRMALGATGADVLRLVVRRGFVLTAVGLVLGVLASIPMARGLSSLIFGVGANDFTAFGVVSLLLLVTALAACAIPARRAARIDPLICLRDE